MSNERVNPKTQRIFKRGTQVPSQKNVPKMPSVKHSATKGGSNEKNKN